MAIIKQDYGLLDGGGGITLDNLSFTNKTLIYTINSVSASWTATEDCIMGGKIQGATNSAILYFNNIPFLWGGNGDVIYIGMTSSSDAHPTTYGIFVPKGTVITTRNSGTYNLEFYSIN